MALSFLLRSAKHCFASSQTGESDIENETKYAYILETFVGNTLKCKKLNNCLWIYDMVDCLKSPILRDPNDIHAKFRWGGENTTVYLLDHMDAFTIEHTILQKKDTNTHANHNAENCKWINTLLISSSMDAPNIWVNEKFDLLPILEQGGILRLKLMPDKMLFISEAVVQVLHTWLKTFPRRDPPRYLEIT